MKQKETIVRVIGTRGFPNVQGGVETHCQELYTRIAKFPQIKIIVYRRSAYVKSSAIDNIEFIDIWAPKNKYLETFLHTLFSLISCIINKTNIIHVHNMGPGIFIPVARLFGIKAVLTYHSQNYLHSKWNNLAKLFLKISEFISIRFSNKVIFVANHLKERIQDNLNNKKSITIYNGINKESKSLKADFIKGLGLVPQKYILAVGRFTEEKGFDYLIKAYAKIEDSPYKLVLVGAEDFKSEYSRSTIKLAKQNQVVLPGVLKGEKLKEIYTHAALFILPSYHEGLPLTVLEAMSYNLNILISNIPANKELELGEGDYFQVGDENDLSLKIKKKISHVPFSSPDFSETLAKYNWDKAASETYKIFLSLSNE